MTDAKTFSLGAIDPFDGEQGNRRLLTTVEPERTLTAPERAAEARERDEALREQLQEDAVGAAEIYDAAVEDVHEHSYTLRVGLGYLADDPGCGECCELATRAYIATLMNDAPTSVEHEPCDDPNCPDHGVRSYLEGLVHQGDPLTTDEAVVLEQLGGKAVEAGADPEERAL